VNTRTPTLHAVLTLFVLTLIVLWPRQNHANTAVPSSVDSKPLPASLQFRQALRSPAAQYSQALLSEAYRRLGIETRFVDVPFGRSLVESNKGTLDGEIARVLRVTSQYPNLLAVPYVLFDTQVYLYINSARCHNCTLAQVPSITYVRGSIIVEELLKKLPASKPVISSGTIESAKALFLSGKVDAVIFAAYRLQENASFTIDEQHIMSLPDYHLLHRQHQQVVSPLAAMLFQLEEEGFSARLRQHYGVAAPRRQLQQGASPFAQY